MGGWSAMVSVGYGTCVDRRGYIGIYECMEWVWVYEVGTGAYSIPIDTARDAS